MLFCQQECQIKVGAYLVTRAFHPSYIQFFNYLVNTKTLNKKLQLTIKSVWPYYEVQNANFASCRPADVYLFNLIPTSEIVTVVMYDRKFAFRISYKAISPLAMSKLVKVEQCANNLRKLRLLKTNSSSLIEGHMIAHTS